jgi:hypothetical protein
MLADGAPVRENPLTETGSTRPHRNAGVSVRKGNARPTALIRTREKPIRIFASINAPRVVMKCDLLFGVLTK